MKPPLRLSTDEALPSAAREALRALGRNAPSAATVARIEAALAALPAPPSRMQRAGTATSLKLMALLALAALAGFTWRSLRVPPAPSSRAHQELNAPRREPEPRAPLQPVAAQPVTRAASVPQTGPNVARRARRDGGRRTAVVPEDHAQPTRSTTQEIDARTPEGQTALAPALRGEPARVPQTSAQAPLPEPVDEAGVLYQAKALAATNPRATSRASANSPNPPGIAASDAGDALPAICAPLERMPARTCTFANGVTLPDDVTISMSQVTLYFAAAAPLPAGRYRLEYVDGCMHVDTLGIASWTVHAAIGDVVTGLGACWLVGGDDGLIVPPDAPAPLRFAALPVPPVLVLAAPAPLPSIALVLMLVCDPALGPDPALGADPTLAPPGMTMLMVSLRQPALETSVSTSNAPCKRDVLRVLASSMSRVRQSLMHRRECRWQSLRCGNRALARLGTPDRRLRTRRA